MKFKFALKIALPILLILVAGTLFFLYYSNRIPENALVYYRIKDHKGEISVWRASNCEINGVYFTVMQNCVPMINLKVIHFRGNINRTQIRIKIQPT